MVDRSKFGKREKKVKNLEKDGEVLGQKDN
jgi:hypothetical protein